MSETSLVGKIAAVTGRIAPGTLGEVVVSVRGGSESYFARAVEPAEIIERGRQVLIVGTAPGRTVFVTDFPVL